jgi:hypothetical protein
MNESYKNCVQILFWIERQLTVRLEDLETNDE